jgi:hypothetical protein
LTALLVTLTIVEIVLVAVVLVYYLLRIAASLRRTAVLLAKVAFGVRAIETQCNVIGPAVLTVNDQLRGIAGALRALTGLAGDRTDEAAAAAGRR